MSYIDNKDGTVTDISTELMWKQNPEEDIYTFEEALRLKSNFAGHENWRLPAIHELFSLVDVSKTDPAINSIFKCDTSLFWSASAFAQEPDYAWVVYFYGGAAYSVGKSSLCSVRLVRST